MRDAIDSILQRRLVPIVTIKRLAQAVPVAEAIGAGGLDIIEVPLRTPVAVEAVRLIVSSRPDMLVGAGTIMRPEQVTEARAAGAHFGVAPGLNEEVVQEARKQNWPFIPGVATPTEIERALRLGRRLLKVFPVEPAGGVALLRAWAAPYGQTGVRFVALGGIDAARAPDYLGLKIVGAVGGSWLVPGEAVEAGDWETITRRVAAAVSAVSAAKPA